MPHIASQKEFRKRRRLEFCYLCGQSLSDGSKLNEDHCPPKAIFKDEDRENYSLTLTVHESCNTRWHKYDEQFSILYDALHGGPPIEAKRDMRIIDVQNTHGTHEALTGVPFIELGFRVAQCAHALMFGAPLAANIKRKIHVPLPEADPRNGNQVMEVPSAIRLACDALCSAQRTNTHNSLVAYNGKFKFVSTWVASDDGKPLCMFAFDIYRLAPLGWARRVTGFPQCFVGYYLSDMPLGAIKCSSEGLKHAETELVYPILS